ncbi:MAG: efflux RND transporter periplasmic adaptor subunit [Syntrophales bacterium]|jgi:RND family efflux transporter MFP subunit|nr:efflux RND transporter periplasmic adaptor subunit [Syntrophales bacterium]MDY0043023.1 efflux RND transporter periplasmic adaptor subunit [Syntrophales bacterium]
METMNEETATPSRRPGKKEKLKTLCEIVLPLLVVAAGIVAASYVFSTAPEAQRKRPPEKAPLVLVKKVSKSDTKVFVPVMGTIVPARQIALRAQVSGTVEKINPEFMTGGIFKTGDEMIVLDQEDYKLAVIQKERQVAEARYALKLEMGSQDVAKREWELLKSLDSADRKNSDGDADLALRKPHLEKAKADLAAAKAELDQAKLNLERTTIRAPFNCIVLAKNVDLGSYISNQQEIAALAGTDEYRVQAAVPVDRLKWISVPRDNGDSGSSARVFYGTDGKLPAVRTGRVVRLLADLEEEGRMARVLIAIKDPLDLKTQEISKPPLLIGEYVKAEIEGPEIENVIAIPRSALRDGGKVWIADKGVLDIRPVEIVWRDAESVLVKSGIDETDHLITSDLAAPVRGMKIVAEGESGDSTAAGRSSR